jgi:hypothetical protein
MDLSNSNNEEHPGRYNRSNLNSLFSKQGILCTRHSSEYPCSGYTVQYTGNIPEKDILYKHRQQISSKQDICIQIAQQ